MKDQIENNKTGFIPDSRRKSSSAASGYFKRRGYQGGKRGSGFNDSSISSTAGLLDFETYAMKNVLDSNKNMLRNPFARKVSISNDSVPSSNVNTSYHSDKVENVNSLYATTTEKMMFSPLFPQGTSSLNTDSPISTPTMTITAAPKISSEELIHSYGLVDDCYFSSMKTLLKKINNWDFNIFFFDQICGGRGFIIIALHLFDIYDFWNYFGLEPLYVHRFINLVCENYLEANPYHNSLHAADVTQALHCLIQEKKWKDILRPDELLSVIIASLCHDINHPGLNQHFLVETNDLLANIQKKEPILENHHWSMTRCLLHQSKIFDHLPSTLRDDIYSQIKSFILATDISKHQEFLVKFRAKIRVPRSSVVNISTQTAGAESKKLSDFGLENVSSDFHDLSIKVHPDFLANRGSLIITDFKKLNIPSPIMDNYQTLQTSNNESIHHSRQHRFSAQDINQNEAKGEQRYMKHNSSILATKMGNFNLSKSAHRHFLLQIALKCSDISNPARQWTISQKWSRMICQELFNQGDIERLIHIPVTAFCDRTQTSIAQMQDGFLQYVVLPIFAEWNRFVDSDLSDSIIFNITSNQTRWNIIMKEIEGNLTIPEAIIPEENEYEIPMDASKKTTSCKNSKRSSAQLMAEYENIDLDSILWRRYSVPLMLPRISDPLRRRSYPKFKRVKWHTLFDCNAPSYSLTKHNIDSKRRATIDSVLLDAPAMLGYENNHSFDMLPSLRRFSLFANPHYFSSSMMTKINFLTRLESTMESKETRKFSRKASSSSHQVSRALSFSLDDSVDNPNETSFSLLNRNLALIYMRRQSKSPIKSHIEDEMH